MCQRFTPQTANWGNSDKMASALLLKNTVEHIDNKRPSYDIGVNGPSLYGYLQFDGKDTESSQKGYKATTFFVLFN